MSLHARFSTLSRASVPLAVAAMLLSATPISARQANGPDIPTGQSLHDSQYANASALPFDMPSTGSLRSSGKKVFAHYWPPLPVSLDNQAPSNDYYARNFLKPEGEKGKHKAYGGYLRDRPITRAPASGTEPTWRKEDMKIEVRQAIAAGLDGFALDIMQIEGDPDYRVWNSTRYMLEAAAAVDPGFKIMLMPDMGGSMTQKSPATLAKYMAQLGASKSAYRLSDGRLVISPFMAEAHAASWWKSFMDIMRNTYKMPVAFVPVFVGHEQNHAKSFAPISYGMGNWGARNPKWNDAEATYSTGPTGRAKAVRAMGQLWMQPVSVQDSRPRSGVFDEAENTQNLRNTWKIARDGGAGWVQIPTWNDYTENAHVAPSMRNGTAILDINSYYLTWFKTGAAPKIVRDTVYLSHRTQPWAAKPSYPQTKLMQLRGGSPARNTVEALTFLTAPGTVTVTVGSKVTSCSVPAGVSSCIAPLGSGSVSAKVVRAGAAVSSVTSPVKVTTTPYVQDLQYVFSSSGRQSGQQPPPAATPTPTPKPTTTTPAPKPSTTSTPLPTLPNLPTTPVNPARPASVVTLAPVADTYANQGAPSRNYGRTSSLVSRGKTGGVSYLRFAIPAAPTGKTLTGAVLQMRTTNLSFAGSKNSHVVRLASNAWSETGVTWRNRPSVAGAVAGTIAGATASNKVYRTSLNASVLRSLVGKSGTVAVTDPGNDNLWFWSRERRGSGYAPRLVLTYN